nr:retrovirus-related Pol polyprotein from transposon TNT 1-94 [Tanacetum cinerariifolium]
MFKSIGNEEATFGYQPNNRESSDKLKEATLAELKLARVQRLVDQSSDNDLMGIQRNISGGIFNQSNQCIHMDRMTPTNSSHSYPYQILQMQQNHLHNVIPRNISSSNLDQYRSIIGNQAGYSRTMGSRLGNDVGSSALRLRSGSRGLCLSRPNGKMIVDSIKNGLYVRRMIATPGEPDLPVPIVVRQLRKYGKMKGSNIGEHKKKAKLFIEWEKFTSTDGESIESYYHHFMQLMNDLKRNKHFLKNIASNLKFLKNLQPEWKRHVTIVHQTKNLHKVDFIQIYDFLKMNQDEVNELRAERIAKSHDPLALMAHSQNSFNFPTTHKDQSSSSTHSQQSFPINNKMLEEMVGISLDIMLDKWHRISKGITHGKMGLPTRMKLVMLLLQGLRELEMGIKPEEAWIQLQAEEFDFMAAAGDPDEIEEFNANYILMANLHHASTSGTQLNKAPVYDTDGSAEVQLNDNCYDNEIFNMFTQEEQYTDLLEPIPKPQLVPQNDNHVTSVVPSMVQSGSTVETSSPTNEETRAHQETVYRNLVDQVAHVNTKMASGYPNPSYLKKAQLKQQSLYNGNLLLEEHDPPDVYDSEETLELVQESREKMRFLKKEIKLTNYAKINHLKKNTVLWNNWYTKCKECKYDKISYDKAYKDMQQKVERLQAQLRDLKGKSSDTPSASNTLDPLNPKLESKNIELEFQVVNYEREISHLKTIYKNLFDSITSNRADTKLYNLIYENAQLRTRVFENTFESMNNTSGTSVTPHVDKPKLRAITPHSKKLHASIPSHSVPQPIEFNVVTHRNVIAPGMFKINPSQTFRVDLVPNKQSSASIRTNPITNSQRHVTFKENVVQICLWCVDLGCSKHMTRNIKLLINFMWKFLGTVRFGNDHIAAILGYGDLKWGNITMTRVYFVEGKRKRASHPPKPVPNSKQRLYLLHMDLCGPIRVARTNGKWYVLVIVDEYSRYTWVHFLRTKDETSEVIKNFLKKIFVRLQAPVIIVLTDNRTEFKNYVLKGYFDSVGITHETSAAKTPQQNRVVEYRNRTLVEAARTMLIFSPALLFLWAEAIATAVYNRRTKKIMETMNVTFDELSAMAFEQNSSRPGLQSMTSGQISSELELTYASSTITPQRPSEHDMDILFESLHNEFIGGRPLKAPRTVPVVPVLQNLQAPTASVFSRFRIDTNKFLKYSSLYIQCFIDVDNPIHVYKLKKALYGLKQALRAWYDKLSMFLLQNGFSKGIIDLTLFTRRFDDDILVVQVYVDDIIFGSTNPRYATLFSDLMKSRFEMSMIGEMKFFFGLQVNQSPSGIFINQSNYVNEILKKYGLNTCDTIGTPMNIKDKLDLDQIGTPIDATKYRSMIGALMYLTSSRPDIVHATCDYGFELTEFLDADYAGCKDTFKSTSGGAQFLSKKLVSWSSKKQDCTSLSTVESEYVSLSACCAQVLWMRTQPHTQPPAGRLAGSVRPSRLGASNIRPRAPPATALGVFHITRKATVIIVRTDNRTEFKNHILKEYFDSVGITHETSAAKTPQQNGVVEQKNRTLFEAARTIVYNQRTNKIMETINVMFDELSTMDFEQNSPRPGLQKYLGGRPSEALRAIPTAPVLQNLQAPTASMSIQDSAPIPTNSSNTPVSSHNVDTPS